LELVELTSTDKQLVKDATQLLRDKKSEISSVSAGLFTNKGQKYFGLDVELENSTVGICAEYSAIGAMVSKGERNIETVVAIYYKGKNRYCVLPPCGKCREFLKAFGNPYVIVQVGREARKPMKVKLSELLPLDWANFMIK